MSLEVCVLVGGIVDPKWPIADLGLCTDRAGSNPEALRVANPAFARKPSPFDEAAIECGLKLRDADPATSLDFIVACEDGNDALMRNVAAFRPDRLRGLAIPRQRFWDAQALAQVLAKVAADDSGFPDLVLVGREFGDYDDGAFAPCFAEVLGRPFVGLVQEVCAEAPGMLFMRERNRSRELIRHTQPVVASVTNAKSNRLRHPLIKNVMASKRERLAVSPCPPDGVTAFRRAVLVTEAVARRQGEVPCRMLAGTADEQAGELVEYLRGLGLARP